MKRSYIKPISAKRKQQYKDELPIRMELCERCGGEWCGICRGGHCEVCGSAPSPPEFILRPHEKKFRSQGGKLTLENSVMVCTKCQNEPHGIKVVFSEPQWNKEK